MEIEVKNCNDKIDNLGQKTSEIDEKMNRLLNLLGEDKNEQRLSQQPQSDVEWFKGIRLI